MSVVKRVASPWSDPTALLINNVEANLSFEFFLPAQLLNCRCKELLTGEVFRPG